jgi:hypothetical protein
MLAIAGEFVPGPLRNRIATSYDLFLTMGVKLLQ